MCRDICAADKLLLPLLWCWLSTPWSRDSAGADTLAAGSSLPEGLTLLPEALECCLRGSTCCLKSLPPTEVFTGAQHTVHVENHARNGLGAHSVPTVVLQPVEHNRAGFAQGEWGLAVEAVARTV